MPPEKTTESSEQTSLFILACGGPSAGLATTMQALGAALGCPISQFGDRSSVSFEWMEHRGGSRGGNPILTQIIAVPEGLSDAVRNHLLSAVDTVLYVADSSAAGLGPSAERFEPLKQAVSECPEPRPELVVQANKRDLQDVAEIEEFASRLGIEDGQPVIETVATAPTGVRPAFVVAVRHGLRHLASGAGDPSKRSAMRSAPIEPKALLAVLTSLQEGTSSGDSFKIVEHRGDGQESKSPADKATSPEPTAAPKPKAQKPQKRTAQKRTQKPKAKKASKPKAQTATKSKAQAAAEPKAVKSKAQTATKSKAAESKAAEPKATESKAGTATESKAAESKAGTATKPKAATQKAASQKAAKPPAQKAASQKAAKPPAQKASEPKAQKSRRKEDQPSAADAPPPPDAKSVRGKNQPPPPSEADATHAGHDTTDGRENVMTKVKHFIRGG